MIINLLDLVLDEPLILMNFQPPKAATLSHVTSIWVGGDQQAPTVTSTYFPFAKIICASVLCRDLRTQPPVANYLSTPPPKARL